MMRALGFLLLVASAVQKCRCRYTCRDTISPVCGSDGELYNNDCILFARNMDHTGNCVFQDCSFKTENLVYAVPWADCQVDCNVPRACNMEYSPRCGSDGIISGNRCVFLWASCGRPEPIVQEPMVNCVNKLCPDNCEDNDADCKAKVTKCRAPWEKFD